VGERFRTRALIVPRALASRLAPRRAVDPPRRILLAHNLLLGDTLMLTPLVAKLRERYPDADVALLASPAAAKAYGDGGLVSRLPHS
jgi:3-deoxy-D-manno-octulosonic-acid transferase